jgi:hypothetical protein
VPTVNHAAGAPFPRADADVADRRWHAAADHQLRTVVVKLLEPEVKDELIRHARRRGHDNLPLPDNRAAANYLNRSERTVRRWEDKEELPVHRLQHDKRGSVYAYTRELYAWRVSRRVVVEATADESPSKRIRPVLWIAVTLFLAAAFVFVGLRVRAADAKVAERGTTNDEAWRLFELARFGDNAGRVQIETGIRYYRQAVELDPTFARAWAGLATAHMALTRMNRPS